MSDQREQAGQEQPVEVNPGYVLGQLAQALRTSETHPDDATRERATRKIERWQQVLTGMLNQALSIGSRTPVKNTPAWATLEVVKGGFATGTLLAEGPLQPHELTLLAQVPGTHTGRERATLNSFFVSDIGLLRLQEWLTNGHYRINVPEEGALLTIAWLVQHGHADAARSLLETLGAWFGRLRFYPLPADTAQTISAHVFRQDVAETTRKLAAIQLDSEQAREREDVLIWAPLYDRSVALFAETVTGAMPFVPSNTDGLPVRRVNGHYAIAGGWPCQHYPAGWQERAQQLLNDYQAQRTQHTRSQRPDRMTRNFAQLRSYLKYCLLNPASLTGRDVGRIRSILASFGFRRGLPGSAQHQAVREEQQRQARLPTPVDYAQILVERLAAYPSDEGLAEPNDVLQPVHATEASRFAVPPGGAIPGMIARQAQMALAAPIETLVARKIIPSCEALALVIPQLTGVVRTAAIVDPELRRLSQALYVAFRKRRSLLLLHLASQVRYHELPWVAALEPFHGHAADTTEVARSVLTKVVRLALTSFPQQIIPNRLLREIRALAAQADLQLPLVDEIAADIFMGVFSDTFLHAAQVAARLLRGSLYERYYAIDYAAITLIDDLAQSPYGVAISARFNALCTERTGNTTSQRWSPAANGMVIEQEQILTTHNLAVLFEALDLAPALQPDLFGMAQQCLRWIFEQLQIERTTWSSTLRTVKNAAYAWRQMLFFLSFLPQTEQTRFAEWAEAQLHDQPVALQERFRPALLGLAAAVAGHPIEAPARPFLGWSVQRPWVLGPRTDGETQ